MGKPTNLETDRLLLRQWKDSDLEPFVSLNADPRVMEFFPDTLSKEYTENMVRLCRERISKRGWGFWAAELKETQEFIGFIGLEEPNNGVSFEPCMEIGWRLAYQYWGNGYATEGAMAALRFAFQALEKDDIVSFTSVQNTRSEAVMKKLGMHRSESTFEHPKVAEESGLKTHCLYTITRNEYAHNNAMQATNISKDMRH